MATRFYLPSTGTAAVTPTIDAEWNDASAVTARPLVTTKLASAFVDVPDTEASNLNTWDILLGQFVSNPLAAQTLSGSFTCVVRAREGAAGVNARSQIVVKVVSGDGLTVRGTLYGPDTTTTNVNEWVNTGTVTAARNAYFPKGTASQAFTDLAIQDGDRIVVEVGARAVNTVTTSTFTAAMRFGDSAGTDLAANETGTTEGNPWIEFSSTLAFYTAPPPPGLTLNPALPGPPVAWWPFTEESGNRASGIGDGFNTLIPSASPPTRGTGPKGLYSAEFVKANSQQFNLPQSGMSPTFPGIQANGAKSITFGGYFRIDAENGTEGGPMGKGASYNFSIEGNSFQLRLWQSNMEFVYQSFEGGAYTAGVWRHYVGRYNNANGEVVLFVDGVKKTPSTAPSQVLNTDDFTIGAAIFKGNFDGGAAEIFVFDQVLTDAQIASIYTDGLYTAGPTAGNASANLAAPKPTLAATATQTFPQRSVSGSLTASKPTIAATSTQVFPARNVAAAIPAKKPAISATSTQVFPARSLTAAIAAKKPALAATATATRRVSAALVSPKPTAAAIATQVFPARSVTAAVAAKKPTISASVGLVIPTRTLSASLIAPKPTIAATSAQVFPARTVSAALSSPKPAVTAASGQVFPARTLTAALTAQKPSLTASATQDFPARALVGTLAAPKPSVDAQVQQSVIGEISLTATLAAPKASVSATVAQGVISEISSSAILDAPKPGMAAAVTQTFPARAVSAALTAPKPVISAATAQVFPARSVSASIAATKPAIASTVTQSVVGSRTLIAALAAKKPSVLASAVQTFPARSFSGALAAKKPAISVTVTHTLWPFAVSGEAAVAKPTIVAAAVQTRTVTGDLEAKKPTASASATHTFPPRALAAVLNAPRPIIVATGEQVFPPSSLDGALWAVKPTIVGTMIKGASPGASNLAGVVRLAGVIDLDVMHQSVIDLDVTYQSIIDPDVTLTGALEL